MKFFHTHISYKETDTPETRAVLIETFCFVEINRAVQNTRNHFRNKQFAGDFRANLDEISTDIVQFTTRRNWKGIV